MAAKGVRFQVDLDNSSNEDPEAESLHMQSGSLLGDIVEREIISNVSPPSPIARDMPNGFPPHKIRGKSSRFRQKHDLNATSVSNTVKKGYSMHATMVAQLTREETGSIEADSNKSDVEKSIDEENKSRITQMSDQEIDAARQELESMLSPSLIERFLKRANIDGDDSWTGDDGSPSTNITTLRHQPLTNKKSSEDQDRGLGLVQGVKESPNHYHNDATNDPDRPPTEPPPDLQAASSPHPPPLPAGIHFPKPPAHAPELDPSSPGFLDSLHKTYFPNLPANPSTQSWMKDPDPSEAESYSATSTSLPASSIRFNFRGQLLPPRLSAQISPSQGLHHHGDAPESAGYTIPELAHLARSALPAQRCMAYQTLGRILYRLGRGDFGQDREDLCEGLWECCRKGRVLDGMVAAASHEDGNRSVWATATEAVWLWRKGGGRRWTGSNESADATRSSIQKVS